MNSPTFLDYGIHDTDGKSSGISRVSFSTVHSVSYIAVCFRGTRQRPLGGSGSDVNELQLHVAAVNDALSKANSNHADLIS